MSTSFQFETPENVPVTYQAAGQGRRFIAWFVDHIILWLCMFVIFIGLLVGGLFSDSITREFQNFDPNKRGEVHQFTMYFIGFFMLINGLGSFLYFAICEYFWRGQTIGKRQQGIRVVKADGFSLDAGSIFLRNLFRVIDDIPATWIVPIVNSKGQRLGDMVAGTIVVEDQLESAKTLHDQAVARSTSEPRFRFDVTALKKARPQDFQAITRILERWNQLKEQERIAFSTQLVDSLVQRMNVPAPPPEQRLEFLEDLLAAEARHQHRKLG